MEYLLLNSYEYRPAWVKKLLTGARIRLAGCRFLLLSRRLIKDTLPAPIINGLIIRLSMAAVFSGGRLILRFFIVVTLILGLGAEAAAQSPPGSYGDAMGWYRREAEKGNPRAQFLYGYMHETGEGVAEDTGLARSWYAHAAAQGERRAQYRFARLYQTGRGGEVDLPAAQRWFRAAAEGGHVGAQSMLGYFYASGVAAEPDPVGAYLWLRLAAQAGDALAAENLDRLTPTMSDEQKAAGEALAKAWK